MIQQVLPGHISNAGPFEMAKYSGMNTMIMTEGDTIVNKERTVAWHRAMARNHEERFFEETGLTMKPLSDEEVEMRAIGGIQKSASSVEEYEKKCFPEQPDDVAAYYRSRQVDPQALRKINREIAERREWMIERAHRGLGRATVGVTRTALNSGSAGFGLESIGTDYGTQAMFETRIAGNAIKEFPNQFEIPNRFASHVMPKLGISQYLLQGPITTEIYTNYDAVSPATSSVTFTPIKMQSVTFWTGEWDTDALFAVAPTLDEADRLGLNVALDHVLISGDTTSGAGLNINAFGGSLALGTKDPRLGFKGLRRANYDGTIGGGSASAFKGSDALGARWTLNGHADCISVLDKYGVDPLRTVTFLPASVRAQFLQDAKARPDTYQLQVEMRGGVIYSVNGSRLIPLGSSVITNASSGGVPTYSLWCSEGMPVNLAADGTYTGTGTYKSAVVANLNNWAVAWKRRLERYVINLPLAGQFATTSSVRLVAHPIYDGVSEAVGFNIL